MIDDAIQRVPLPHRFAGLYVLLGLAATAAIAAAAYLGTSNVIVQTHTVHVKQSFGTPDQSVAGAQVNQALAGLTCDIYSQSASHTVVCHQ